MIRLERGRPSAGAWEHHALIDLGHACDLLSSAALGGGFRRARYIVSRSVDKDWNPPDPVADMRAFITNLGLSPGDCVGLMTSVAMAEMRQLEAAEEGWRVTTLLTVGLGNAAAAGRRAELGGQVGTINLIVVVTGQLSAPGLVGAVQTATEAKTLALLDLGVSTVSGEPASGTSTDTVTVVNHARAPFSDYAGTATVPGYLIGKTVREGFTAVKAGSRKETP